LLPVVTTMPPSLLEIAIRIEPRARDCMFSSVMSGWRPANIFASALPKPSTGSAIGTMS
jgi:hypothetical protein